MPHYSYAERVIISNQFKLLSLATKNNDEREHYRTAQKVFAEGLSRAYDRYTEDVYRTEMSEQDGEETADALDMYWQLQNAFEQLPDKVGIDPDDLLFPGFDGNNETMRLIYATFMIEDEKKFQSLKLRENSMNSHHPTTETYRRMVAGWRAIQRSISFTTRNYSNEEIQAILFERIDPPNRG